MYVIKAFLLLLFSISLLANNQLQSNYFIINDSILISDIIKNSKNDTLLYTINSKRHSKRVKAKELIKLLNKYGYKDITSKHSYIQFTKKSPINMSRIALSLQNRYKQEYKNIDIKEITITPRSYMQELPKEYTVVIGNKAHFHKDGHLYIKTLNNKKIFFNYRIKAIITVLKTKIALKREEELSRINVKKDSIMLDNFRAMPLQELQKSTYQAKHKIKKGTILTTRDVIALFIIKRNANVNVLIQDSNMAVSFIAKATQHGRFGQTITVVNKQGKRLKVIVTGRNSAEIRN